ncbi:MAG: bifunctional serine/threonine-protein kinase/formylglycine-generating enzyme family protein [Bryobacter sp.]|nr:bifunctional serine/threonine-protein kinase/formylglycine-generating enzyme family protein [Bryobacter sp.]
MQQQQRLGKYQFDKFLGGGMSHVYKATDTLINRTVVVKILTESGMNDDDTKKRFLREAQMAGSITHENIIRVYDFGEYENRPYMVMEYLEGKDLRAAVQANEVADNVAKLKVLVQLARAMQHIHQLGIVHRDLKPDNVFLSNSGSVKLMDFGIAKTRDLSITKTGYTLGTPYYMSPEQVTAKDVTEKADIYSFGIVMFELFTGSKPFAAQNVQEVFFKILNEPIDTAPLVAAKVPGAIVDLIRQATEKDPTLRPADFGEIVRKLDAVLRTFETGDEETIKQLTKARFVVTKQMYTTGLVALGLLAVLLVWNLIPKPAPPPPPKKEEPIEAKVVELPATMATSTGPMVLIPKGEFIVGEGNQKLDLPDFYLDKYEVTNEHYKRFAQSKNWPLPEGFPESPEAARLPVVNVSFDDAREFATWAGKRLPTGEEWEKAARGPQGRTYPWGFEHLPDLAVVADNKAMPNLKGPREVGSWSESTSKWEAMDLAGNVFEWVDERVEPSPGAIKLMASLLKPPPTAEELWMQIRGGSYVRPLLQNASTQFASLPVRYRNADIGFRCAVDANAKPK